MVNLIPIIFKFYQIREEILNMKYGITLLSIASLLIGQQREIKVGGGPFPNERPAGVNCISDEERSYIMDHMLQIDWSSMRDTVMFQDPMGNGGMVNNNESVNHHIINYVDENPLNGWINDYTCNYVTYDGHQGTDIGIGGFYHMDEMDNPILAAAPGVVIYTHDGEFDRYNYWNNSAESNTVVVSHSDGNNTFYFHMKKYSVSVSVGDTISTGDTLGFVGSSGISSSAHLHFEVQDANGNVIDPWEGNCSPGLSRWVDQVPFIGDTSTYEQKLLWYVSTSYPNADLNLNYLTSENLPVIEHINPGEYFLQYVLVRNLFITDTLKRRFYRDGELFTEYNWVPGQTTWWPTGIEYMTQSFWYFWGDWWTGGTALGNWTVQFFINSKLVGENSFICDDIPNQTPTVDLQQFEVELGETITGEFTATDDGNPFWFNLESDPNNGGSIELYGGRRRKFSYTAPMDFNGSDVIGVSATDDRGVTGPMNFILFNVFGTGLTNINVEPTYVAFGQDSVFIISEILGGNDEISVQAFIYNEISGETVAVDLMNNDGTWSTHWSPASESFFSVDLEMINGLENDTIYYEDAGYFTSVGPLGVNIFGELTAHPGDGIVLDFNVENNSTEQIAPDISVSFEAESMNCLSSISEDIFNMGDIPAGESTPTYFFVALLNDNCNSDSTILFNVHINSGENLYWHDDFVLDIEMLGTIGGTELPTAYALGGAYPNPFNPDARIDYDLVQKNYVTLDVHNLVGRKIKTLVSSKKESGFHSIRWDATNDAGEPVAAGVYLYTIQAGEFRKTRKMVLLK